MYLLGEPFFGVPWRAEFFAPIGQAKRCYEVLGETRNMGEVATKLRDEYSAIARALKSMGVDFRLVCTDVKKIDQDFALQLCHELGCKMASFAGFSRSVTLYPRDFCSIFPSSKVVLVNPRAMRVTASFKEDWTVSESLYGEGGRILFTDQVALVGDRVMQENCGPSRETQESDLGIFRQAGITVGKIPLFVTVGFGHGGRTDLVSFNDHLDRVACLLKGNDSSIHLVIDPATYSVEWVGENRWAAREPKETMDLLRSVCNPQGITVHTPKRMQIPGSLNLLQLNDGRVLMSSGDSDVQELVTEIVGKENVTTTMVPIRFYPTWAHAGIRCLVNEAPDAIMKRV